MRILITNNTLGIRAGTEVYVRDLALALRERGHTPIAFSTELGEVAEELRSRTIAVIDDVERLAERPDVIHGHHHLETMIAMLAFPDVPVVSFCHGWTPWEEEPPFFPSIRRYVAVDDPTFERLTLEHGIAPERIRVLRNFVDLERFHPRPPLPARPRRALVFSNQATENGFARAIREGCARCDISVEVVGASSGTPVPRPEDLLGQFDIVFAKGRSALEALAVGTAVVPCDAAGLGSMVTLANAERLRALNFGLRELRRPVTADAVEAEVCHYDAADAAGVSRWIRQVAGMSSYVDAILDLYRVVIDEAGQQAPPPEAVRVQWAGRYLRRLRTRLAEEREATQRAWVELERMNTERIEAQRIHERCSPDIERIRAQAEATARERDELRARAEAAIRERDELRARDEAAIRERDELRAENEAMKATATWHLRSRLRRSTWIRATVDPILRRVRR